MARAKNSINAFVRGMPLEVTFAPMWQSFAGCGDASCYGNFVVTTTATKFIDDADTTPPRRFYSVTNNNNSNKTSQA
jgi:hypothetical protein